MPSQTILLLLLDLLWSCLVITPLTVLGWRGMWDLLDQVFPNDPQTIKVNTDEAFTAEISPWSALTSYFLGLVTKVILDLCREKSGKFAVGSNTFAGIMISWTFRILQGMAMVAYWRGSFGLLSNNLGEGVVPLCLVLAISLLLLAVVKVSNCAIFPPLVLLTDTHDQTFQNGLYFRSSPGEQGFLLLDCIFSNFLIKIIAILSWWSIWCLENKYFSLNIIGEKDEKISYDSLATGYLLVILTFMAHKLTPYERLHSQAARVTKYLIIMLSIIATVNVWRGVWSLLDHFFFPFITGANNYVLSLMVSIFGLTLTLTTNILGGDFINFDDDEILDIQYWSLLDKSLKKEETEPICSRK